MATPRSHVVTWSELLCRTFGVPHHGARVIIACRATVPASDAEMAADISDVLRRRAAVDDPPVSIAVSDGVALGIAHLFRSTTPSGQVMERFGRGGSVESDALIEAARFEQGFASAEGYAALHCLVIWVRARVQRRRMSV
jgi:hypothetical protein